MSVGRRLRSRAGITLVEVLVATAVLVMFTVAVISVVVVSRDILITSAQNEPDAAAAQSIADTVMADLSRGKTEEAVLETDTGAMCVNDEGFSPGHANRMQFSFEYVFGDNTDLVPGYVIYVRVYGDDGEYVYLKAFSGIRMPDADGVYG